MIHLDLGNGYHIAPISYQEYRDACARLEDQIFGEYFAFRWDRVRTAEQQQRLQDFDAANPAERICLGIFHEGACVGWHYSQQTSGTALVMRDTGLLPAHQNKKIYSRLLPVLLEHFEQKGYELVYSYHRTTNNQVIVPKLRAGFVINGLATDAYGQNVELIYSFNPEYREALHVRSGYRTPRGRTAELLGL